VIGTVAAFYNSSVFVVAAAAAAKNADGVSKDSATTAGGIPPAAAIPVARPPPTAPPANPPPVTGRECKSESVALATRIAASAATAEEECNNAPAPAVDAVLVDAVAADTSPSMTPRPNDHKYNVAKMANKKPAALRANRSVGSNMYNPLCKVI